MNTKRKRPKIKLLLVQALVFLVLWAPFAQGDPIYRENPKSHVQFYIKAYGLTDTTSHPLAKRAYFVFEKISRVADKRMNHLPGLKVINSPGDPWSISLPDGNIVLSVKAVEVCYSGVGKKEGDARLAFILGHELAHLANNDFWHLETFMALSSDPDPWSRRLKKILEDSSDVLDEKEKKTLAISKEKEMAADDLGFIYASISGFSMDTLSLSTHGEDFFSYWMKQTQTKIDLSHPHPKERARLLQVRLARLKEKIDFFEFGTRLSHFGRYDDAIYFLKEFQTIFPSREVFNNIGYCYLQKAIKRMPASVAYDYWFPWILDLTSRADIPLSRSGNEQAPLPDSVKQFLHLSIDYFEKACEADQFYVPSRLNLVSAYYYSGEIYKARAMVEEALRLDPDNAEIHGLKALVMIEEAPNVDMWPYVMKTLKTLSNQKDAPVSIQYNLARLLEKRKRNGEALSVFKQLAKHPENLPHPFKRAVLEKAGVKNIIAENQKAKAFPFSLALPLAIGQDLRADQSIRKNRSHWKKSSYAWQNGMINGAIYTLPTGSKILAVNDFVEMILVKGDFGDVNKLTQRFGKPFADTVWGRTVLSYSPGWSIVSESGHIKELWVSEH